MPSDEYSFVIRNQWGQTRLIQLHLYTATENRKSIESDPIDLFMLIGYVKTVFFNQGIPLRQRQVFPHHFRDQFLEGNFAGPV